jgi:NADPH-dependent 2,4-dienoyl-CoA reductase/sulfur reductase-like enzyme
VINPAKACRLVIVGASLAGLRAAESARNSGFTGELVIIGEEEHLPYDRPPLSKQYLGDDATVPYLRETDSYTDTLNATLLLGQRATALVPSEKIVVVGDRLVPYDALVIATGSKPRELPGSSDTSGIVSLRTMEDASVVRRALDAKANITIVGAGIIGAEIATAARDRGCNVTIIEATQFPLERAIGREMGTVLSDMHARNGTELKCGVSISDIKTEAGRITSVVLSDGTEVATDLMLVSIGVIPATSWLQGSGIELRPDGSIACDEFLQTNLKGVFAAGDVASWPNTLTGLTGRLETWTSANEQGAVAGRNAVRVSDMQPYSTVPYFWSDWYSNRIQFAGSAAGAEPQVVSGSVERDKFVALYRSGDQVVGALAVNEPSRIMKDRRKIQNGTSWVEMLEHYRELEQGLLQEQAGAV